MAGKTLREKFEESYAAVSVPANNKQGFKIRYVYSAPWYVWDVPREKLRREKRKIALFSLVSFLPYLFAVTVPSALNRMPVVFLPSMLALCCHILELSGVVQFLAARYQTTKFTYEEVNRILRFVPLLRAGGSLFAGAACLYGLAAEQAGLPAVWMCLGFWLSAAAAWAVEHWYSRLPLSYELNTNAEKYESAMPSGKAEETEE